MRRYRNSMILFAVQTRFESWGSGYENAKGSLRVEMGLCGYKEKA